MKEIFPQALQNLLHQLHEEFNPERLELLEYRKHQQEKYDQGDVPHFVFEHLAHKPGWKVAPIPKDLLDRRVEITGPISSTKMVIQMLSENQDGEVANTAMLDFEDSMCPTWENVNSGLRNLIGVANGNLEFTQTDGGKNKTYKLNPKKMAHPMVRIRGLHLNEDHVRINGESISAGIFDLACSAFHTAKIFLDKKMTPKFYVPKTEYYQEACWWNKVFCAVERNLNLPENSLRVTFLIETLPAAFQMEEILYEIRERTCGLNGGRWDKIFSDIKTLGYHRDRILADRASIDMRRTWMDNYAKRLIKICHDHGAFAMGGMSAFTPGKDEATRKVQTEKVLADKAREASIGHDGCWVSHPYFIGIARKQFEKQNQLDVTLPDFPKYPDLLPDDSGPKTLEGLKTNLRVGIAYQRGWDQGLGCVAFENLMEDLATLEISRAQTWQWLHHGITLDDGTKVTPELVKKLFSEELERIYRNLEVNDPTERQAYREAMEKVQNIFLEPKLADFFSSAINNNKLEGVRNVSDRKANRAKMEFAAMAGN
jgi:malate synthase